MLENTEEKNRIFQKLLIQRANIVKNAFEKYKSFNEILDESKSLLVFNNYILFHHSR